MLIKDIWNLVLNGIVKPEVLWKKMKTENEDHISLLKYPILPTIGIVALLSGILSLIFGFNIPFIGTVRPSFFEMIWSIIGTVALYLVFLYITAWILAFLAEIFGGKKDLNKAVLMLFLISLPNMAGQVLSTIPYIGWILGLGFAIYSLVLLYKAIPVFLEVPLEAQVRYFIFAIVGVVIASIIISATLGRIFMPSYDFSHQTIDFEQQTKDNMSIVEEIQSDSYTPPKDGYLTGEQVERFVSLVTKVKSLEKEQMEKLKEKYNHKSENEDFTFSDIFSGMKELSNVATLEMKVIKTNDENWAEYQWVKDQVREAYYTPSLNDITKHNAKLIEKHLDTIKLSM